MKTIGLFQIGDRVKAYPKVEGFKCTQFSETGTVIYCHYSPYWPSMSWVDVQWDNKFTNAKISISLDGRILDGMNGNDLLTRVD